MKGRSRALYNVKGFLDKVFPPHYIWLSSHDKELFFPPSHRTHPERFELPFCENKFLFFPKKTGPTWNVTGLHTRQNRNGFAGAVLSCFRYDREEFHVCSVSFVRNSLFRSFWKPFSRKQKRGCRGCIVIFQV